MKALLILSSICSLVLGVAEVSSAVPPPPPKIKLEKIVTGLQSPVYFTSDGTNRNFVVEQPGRILIVRDGKLEPKPYLDIRNEVTFQGEMGLLSVAFSPQFATNGYIYVDYTNRRPNLKTFISEFHVDPTSDQVDPKSERVILTIDQPFPNHNGGQLQFGPDGMLYIAMGDGGSHDDPNANGQNTHALLAKILRIDVNKRDPYGIPADNPFADGKDGAPEVFAWGVRNPWRFSFDRKTGDLWAGDVGQNNWEEVDIIKKGGNYGWRPREAFHPNPNLNPIETIETKTVDPVIEYPHNALTDKNLSITGGFVYRGKAMPGMVGWYIYGDYASGRIWGLKFVDGNLIGQDELLKQDTTTSSFGEDVDGELYLCDYSHGVLWKIIAP